MWFRKPRLQRDSRARGGVAVARRRPPKLDLCVVEALLEERALMSHLGMGMPHHPMTLFTQTNLVSDGGPDSVSAKVTDSNLVNAWGLAAGPATPWWVNDNGTGVATLYNGSGMPQPLPNATPQQPLIVTIPPPKGGMPPSTPTGIVFTGNSSDSDFVVSAGGKSGPSRFVFATEDGTISGWNPTVDQTHAILAVDNSASGAVYKGLALANNELFATNFHAGTVDVFDSSFNPVPLETGAFTDPHIPTGFAPFGIAAITPPDSSSQQFLVVTYAKQDAAKHDDVAGPGNGFVDIFDTSGHLIQRVASRGTLNSPWGIAVAPSNFGSFSGDLLIGNFGNGRINAFKFPDKLGADHADRGRSAEAHRFQFEGQLRDLQRRPITIDGLWSLAFGKGDDTPTGPTNTLFFTAGPNGEQNGLFGTLTVATM